MVRISYGDHFVRSSLEERGLDATKFYPEEIAVRNNPHFFHCRLIRLRASRNIAVLASDTSAY